MEEIYSYTLLALGSVIFWLILHYWYKIKSREYIQSFIDSQETVIILSTEEKVTMINKESLKLLGFNSLAEFQKSKKQLLEFFQEVRGCDDCLDKYTYGKKWIVALYEGKRKNNKVKISSKADSLGHYYQIKVSKFKNSQEYILNFTDISSLEREKHKLEKSADFDPLTNVYNRVKLMSIFKDLKYASKHNEVVSLILFDIDKFKRINDTYGHNIGDKVLIELSSLVKGMLREHDILARWGGEEFVILLSDTSIEKAKVITERIRREIEKYPFETVKKVTCSFGITELTSRDDNQVDFLERADQALYEAKEGGRNRVVVKLKSKNH
ncbi:MAG TPA: GGDEF domain-containing protein [Campylobacterales bacterium]|nr:GGDEF domain-containing protein [Campylobacterales bacterium]HHS93541.1 GGDEF domain-containing protein [Campylobacterales bacterium]